jgi:hypothetical protein
VKSKTAFFQIFSSILTAAALLSGAGIERARAGPTPINVETVQDPFQQGWVFQSIYTEADTAKQTTRGLDSQIALGSDHGVVGALVVPLLLTDTPESTAGASVPRTGGVGNDRVELDGYFRFWGNSARYFGTELGLAFPYQSDSQIRNTSVNSFLVPASLLIRYGWDKWSFRFSFTDTWTFPSVTTNKTTNTYHDQSDSFSITTYISLFQKTRFSPYLKWSEGFAYSKETGTDSGTTTFVTKGTDTSESRTLGIGIDTIPWKNVALVVSPEIDYKLLPFQGSNSPLDWQVRFRWAF